MDVLHVEHDERSIALETGTADDDLGRCVVDFERDALELTRQRRGGWIRRRVRRDDLDEIRAVWNGRRVPHENRIGDISPKRVPPHVALSPVPHVVRKVIVVLVVGTPDNRLQALLVRAAPE